jgi:hypothetical protein
MYGEPLKLGEEDGYEALRGHVVEKARQARERYGPDLGPASIERLLADGELVRFPTRVVYSTEALRPGEFAFAQVSPQGPKGGFTLFIHEEFEQRPEVLSLLVAYHIPSINYLDIAGREEAELFGAALHGLALDEYYDRLCELVDALPGPKAPVVTPEVALLLEPPSAAELGSPSSPSPGGCGSGACGCS